MEVDTYLTLSAFDGYMTMMGWLMANGTALESNTAYSVDCIYRRSFHNKSLIEMRLSFKSERLM
jgi:hypothetical protein